MYFLYIIDISFALKPQIKKILTREAHQLNKRKKKEIKKENCVWRGG